MFAGIMLSEVLYRKDNHKTRSSRSQVFLLQRYYKKDSTADAFLRIFWNISFSEHMWTMPP